MNHREVVPSFSLGPRLEIIIVTSSERPIFWVQPQSSRAALSSMESGQESAMAWRWSGLYSTSTGKCFLISLARSATVKLIPDRLQLVLTLTFSGSAFMISRVALIASSMYIMGKAVLYLTKHQYLPVVNAPQKIAIAQSVVPPPGNSFQLMMPGYLRLRTSNPYFRKQYWPSSSPAYLVTPYMVVGSIEVCWGVLILGEVGPKTAIELAQNTFFTLNSTQRSKSAFRAIRFTSQARSGFFSPVTERRAAR